MFGDKAATDRAFAAADHVVKMEFNIGRVTAVTMELRAALGHYDAATERYTLYAGSGGAVRQKQELAERARRRRRTSCACSRSTSAAISARATGPMSSSAWCCGRRRSSAGR